MDTGKSFAIITLSASQLEEAVMKSKMIVAKTKLLWLGEVACMHKQTDANAIAIKQTVLHVPTLRGKKTAGYGRKQTLLRGAAVY